MSCRPSLPSCWSKTGNGLHGVAPPKFKHKEFNIESVGDDIFDIPFGNSFYLNNVDIISDDDKSGENNNIKLVAKRIEYSITKPVGGKGGLRRKIKGSKVFT